jgi:chemotaxis receptor (MCP) glutamine deamidase CheD
MPEPALHPAPQPIDVPVDTFAVSERDDLLCATARDSLVVCLYDAVEEAGAMLHLRVVPSRADRSVHELTDEFLASDLLLLERCCAAYRAACPGARHWQARVVLHCGADNELAGPGELLLEFVRAHALESRINVVQAVVERGQPRQVVFRPAMGNVRIGS